MLSKNVVKYLNSLQLKKYRQEHGSFLVEGAKSVEELLASDFQIEMVIASDQFYKENTQNFDKQSFRIEIATPDELSRVGTLQTNDAALAVVKTKPNDFLYAEKQEYVLVLDDIRDPGWQRFRKRYDHNLSLDRRRRTWQRHPAKSVRKPARFVHPSGDGYRERMLRHG